MSAVLEMYGIALEKMKSCSTYYEFWGLFRDLRTENNHKIMAMYKYNC